MHQDTIWLVLNTNWKSNIFLPVEATVIVAVRARLEASLDFVETVAQEFDVESFVAA